MRFLITLILGLFAAHPTHAMTRHAKFSSSGHSITVEFFAPELPGPHPAVLILHGAGGTLFDGGAMRRFAERLQSRGYVALVVHYFDRTRTSFANDKGIHQGFATWLTCVNDAVAFAAEQPEVDREHIGCLGYSLGAYLSVAEAAKNAKIKAVVEIAGGIYPGQKIQRMPPTLILHGSADRRVPVARAHDLGAVLKKIGAPHEIQIYEGQAHVFAPATLLDAAERAVKFFDRHLH